MYRATPKDGIAWVTGASSGIGRAVAVELARRGWRVAITARRAAELESVKEEAKGLSGTILPYPGDVTDEAGMNGTVALIEADHGPIALAFLNAGTYFVDKEGLFDPKSVMKTFDINVGGAVHCLSPLIDTMSRRKQGQIAVNASVAGYGGLPRSSAYGATKAALINMVSSLKFSLDPVGITLQLVCPGFVKTPLTDRNDFPMPFLLNVEEAATRICNGFETAGFEITFPRRLSWMLKALNVLPYSLYFPLVARMTGQAGVKA